MKTLLQYMFVIFIFTVFLTGNIAAAQSVEDQLLMREQNLMAYAEENSITLTKVFHKDRSLGEGGVDTAKLDDLRSITNFIVVGACDGDCSGLGLKVEKAVYGGEPEIKAEDMSGDKLPRISFLKQPFAKHKLSITMLSCKALICEYGVDIYQIDKVN